MRRAIFSLMVAVSMTVLVNTDSDATETKKTPAPSMKLKKQVPPGIGTSDPKEKFLKTRTVEREGDFIRFQVDARRGVDNQLNIPVIHTYNTVGAAVPLAIRFPPEFAELLPGSIQIQLADYDLDAIEIYFAPQLEVRVADASLKPAYWMFPHRPKKVVGSPNEYKKNVLLGIFESDFAIDDQVKSNELKEFEAQLHDNLVSPDTGHLKISAAPHRSFAFYSLAIFKEQKRAAVTLHWILTSEDKEKLDNLLVENTGKTVLQLLEVMNSTTWLKNSSLMMKLNSLTGLKPGWPLPKL